tara:strand:- start:708 stop:1115 length:408 start_codon:yes stop_codon:yes gene_type:complete
MKKYKPGGLVGRQGELDKNKDGKISGADFKMMMGGGKMEYGMGGKPEYGMGGKPEYAHGGMAPGDDNVSKLLEMLADFDQNATVGEFLEVLKSQAGVGGMPEGGGMGSMGQQGPPMRNMPPGGAEELLMQMGRQR